MNSELDENGKDPTSSVAELCVENISHRMEL
jgi:hypothetical protein